MNKNIISDHAKYFLIFTEDELTEMIPKEVKYKEFVFSKNERSDLESYQIQYICKHNKFTIKGKNSKMTKILMASLLSQMGAITPEAYLEALEKKIPVPQDIAEKIFKVFGDNYEIPLSCKKCGKCQALRVIPKDLEWIEPYYAKFEAKA